MSTAENRKFLEIFKIEMEDLWELLGEKEVEYHNKFKDGLITEHVCNSNVALLRNEECCICACFRIVNNTNPAAFETVDELSNELASRIRSKVKKTGLAEAALYYIDKKLARVRNYIETEE